MVDENENKQDFGDSIDEVEEEFENTISSSGDVYSFDELDNLSDNSTDDLIDGIGKLFSIASTLLWNIERSETLTDKVSAVKKVSTDLSSRVNALIDDYNNMSDSTSKSLANKTKDFIDKMIGKEAPYKTEGGKRYTASDFAYVPDRNKPSTWKLRLADGASGKVTVAQLGRAAAAFSSGGFRGNKVQLPSGAVAAAKRKIRAAYRKLGVSQDEMPDSIKEKKAFLVWKESSGNYRWFATYSNAFRDDDNPPEIISKSSHKRFVDMVDKGETPMPELWHWHVKDTKYGVADWVAFDEDTGFAMASGHILPGHEKEAEALSEMDVELGVSHGMPVTSIVRDEKDNTVINEHVTVEISDLPMFAAANKLTDFTLFKENDEMTIPDVKKEYLIKVGMSPEKVAEIDAKNKSLSESAKDAGIETKGSDGESKEKVEVTETKVEKPVEEKVEAKAETKEVQYATKEEVADVIATSLKSITDMLGEVTKTLVAMSEKVETLDKELKEKTDNISATPTASLAAMIARNLSAVGAKETAIRKDSPLLKEAPAETVKEQTNVASGNNFVDSIISGIISKK